MAKGDVTQSSPPPVHASTPPPGPEPPRSCLRAGGLTTSWGVSSNERAAPPAEPAPPAADATAAGLTRDARSPSHAPPRPRSAVQAFLPLLIGGGVALGAWHASGSYFTNQAHQAAADRWDELRVCLLGDALKPGDRPSERVRRIHLADHASHTDGDAATWPKHCLPYAEALDQALAARPVKAALGPLPSAVTIVKSSRDPAARADLDVLFAELEAADLPLPKHNTVVVPAPAAARPLFAHDDVPPLGKVLELGDVATSLDPGSGRTLRVLLPEAQPSTCHFDGGSLQARWKTVVCKTSPLTVSRDARLTLAPTEKGGLDLIRVSDAGDADGIYDASTGLLVLKPRYFDTQTHVTADGRVTILFAQLRSDEKRDRVEHFHLVRTQLGKPPEPRRLKIPADARVLLMAGEVMWFVPGDDKAGVELVAQPILDKRQTPLGPKRSLGTLPPGSRFLDRCSDGNVTAWLFGSGLAEKRYSLVFHDGKAFAEPTDIGTIAGRVTMTCHEGKVMLQRLQHRRVSRWQCTAAGCEIGLSDKLPMLDAKVLAVAPVADRVAVVWKDAAGALRLRVASPNALAATPDSILFDAWDEGGTEMTALSLVSGGNLAILLAQDVGRRLYALRINAQGAVESVRIAR